MIWYLLYPLRRTTKPPDLAPSHPLRRTFSRYGRYVACHVVTALLISAAVATILIYPIPYIFTRDFVNGASYVPYHVWTVAQPLPYDATATPDIVMRSIWLHSSYMEALRADLLVSALDLQNQLLGETRDFNPTGYLPEESVGDINETLSLAQRDAMHISNGLTAQSWFFHSPLIYWQYSREKILADPDILTTINNKKNQSNFANTTLRHSVVFSGKRFEDRRLVAADAIVITLLYRQDSPVGREWEKRAASLPSKFSDQFDVYPSDGRSKASQLYEFQFRPISAHDTLSLAFAYGLAFVYFLVSLSKLRAVKSKMGLIVTIVAQIALSVMSSFTVCAVFKFDLSRIPQAAYPLVVLSMSLENILRLINAVILTPLEESTSSRIGQAFGQTAHTALASSMQNVMILAGLSRLVSPGVSAFCVFAAVAIIFDFFYLSTFFLSVLSVDVRRMELGDALAKAALRQSRRKGGGNGGRALRSDSFFQGKIAWSTRIAGTVIMLGFVFIAQWHFFGDDSVSLNLLRFSSGPKEGYGPRAPERAFLKSLHQARSHASWIRNQDHETAQEVIRLIKPRAYSYVARVFDPLVFVKKNSDRIPHSKEPALLPAAYDFVHHQLLRFIVIVVFVVAALRLLMNYLLWGEDAELRSEDESIDVPMVSVRTMKGGHTLDVAMLTKSKAGHIVSAGLDRVVRIWDVRGPGSSYVIADGQDREKCPFPILHMAVDDTSTWLALLSPSKVSLWNLKKREWGEAITLETSTPKPATLFFSIGAKLDVNILHYDGALLRLAPNEEPGFEVTSICPEPLAVARSLIQKDGSSSCLSVIMVTKRGSVYRARRRASTWESQLLDLKMEDPSTFSQIVPLSPLGVFVLAASEGVYFVDADQGRILRYFKTEQMIPRSLQCTCSVHHGPKPGIPGLKALTLCYCASRSGECVVQTYTPADDHEAVFLEKSSNDACEEGKSTKELKKRIKNPGTWHVLSDGSVVGVRQVGQDARNRRSDQACHGLRRRNGTQGKKASTFANWEVWASSSCTQPDMEETRRLVEPGEESHHLLVSQLGPKVTVGLRSVAFAFGNVIKLVTTGGNERYDTEEEEQSFDALRNTASRRRKAMPLNRTRTAI